TDIPPARAISRAMTALVLNRIRPEDGEASDVLRKNWASDRAAMSLVEKAASTPATTTGTGWAAELAAGTRVAAAFIASLGGAAAALVGRGLELDLGGINTINLPYASTLAPAAWVVEGAPIPVSQDVTAKSTLGPSRKLAIIQSISAELVAYSAISAEL